MSKQVKDAKIADVSKENQNSQIKLCSVSFIADAHDVA
jgi:hypothetical protein